MDKKKIIRISITLGVIILLVSGYISWTNYKQRKFVQEQDLFYFLRQYPADSIDNIKFASVNKPQLTGVCISKEDKARVVNTLLALEPKLLSKSKNNINIKIPSKRCDIYIAPNNAYADSPIMMSDNSLIYKGYTYNFEVNAIPVFEDMYGQLTNLLTLIEFDEKYRKK